MGCVDIQTDAVAVSTGEQLPEYGLVRPKQVAIECDFNDTLN
jgi:hypothetical protein